VLGHDHDPQRFDTSAALTQSGCIGWRHRHGWFLAFQALHHEVRPSTVQHILDLVPIDSLVGDQHQCDVITICYASEAHIAPSIPVPHHPVSDIAQTAPEPPNSIVQAFRRMRRDDGKAGRRSCRPLAHAIPP
jgi:hypothetical protein